MNTNLKVPEKKRLFIPALLMLILYACMASVSLLGDPAIQTDHSAYYPGEDIIVTFADGPANPKDWVGIYPDGVTPGSVGSTRWQYTDAGGGTQGVSDGMLTFAAGLNFAGTYQVYLLLNDGYTIAAVASFGVVDPGSPLVRPDKRSYLPGEPITVSFQAGPGNPKDWIGIYKAGEQPGGPSSTLWLYVDGTKSGLEAKTDGSVQFAAGLPTAGDYVVYFLQDNGYTILAQESFKVATPVDIPRVISVSPADKATDTIPLFSFNAVIKNGATHVKTDSIVLTLDGAEVPHQTASAGDTVTVTAAQTALLPAGSEHTYKLSFTDDASTPIKIERQGTFTVINYRNVVLPAPIVLETFDSTDEGKLPGGWTEKSYTEITNPDVDLGNLDSASYATWTVVNSDRFEGSFVTYSDPSRSQAEKDDYHRVLTPGRANVVNGQWLENLASGNILFGDSGYRNGRSQVLYVFTPDFDLSGKKDIYLSFHSLWEQNQDSIGAVEYSIDGGATWLPIVYYLDPADILKDDKGNVDAVATFNATYADVAAYTDPDTGEDKGGNYGAFLGASISPELGAYIAPRINDDPADGKRVELFRLPAADNQSKVRFRIAHAGTDSWYFGIDDFGVYSIAPQGPPAIHLAKSSYFTSEDISVSFENAPGNPKDWIGIYPAGIVPGSSNSLLWYYLDGTKSGTLVKTEGSLSFAKGLSTPGDYTAYLLKNDTYEVVAQQNFTVLQAPVVIPSHFGYLPGEDIVIHFAYDPGNAKDWVGFYPSGVQPGTQNSLIWQYVGGGQTPSAGKTSGDLTFSGGLTSPGKYDIYLLLNDGYTKLAKTSIDILGPNDPMLRSAKEVYAAQESIEVNFSHGPGNPKDWIGIYPVDAVPGQINSLLWEYVDGTPTAGEGKTDGTVAFHPGLAPGDYAVYFLLNDGYTILASDRFTIAPSSPIQLTISRSGANVTLNWTGGTGPYKVQKATRLNNPDWTDAGDLSLLTTFSETTGPGPVFYRVVTRGPI